MTAVSTLSAEQTTPDGRRVPRILRCCGYRPKRGGNWVGYCLELHLRVEGRDWDELLEALIMAATMRLAHFEANPEAQLPGKAPFSMRLCYAYIAMLHFVRPRGPRCLADLSSNLLLS